MRINERYETWKDFKLIGTPVSAQYMQFVFISSMNREATCSLPKPCDRYKRLREKRNRNTSAPGGESLKQEIILMIKHHKVWVRAAMQDGGFPGCQGKGRLAAQMSYHSVFCPWSQVIA